MTLPRSIIMVTFFLCSCEPVKVTEEPSELSLNPESMADSVIAQESGEYICPMHPEIRSHEPGKCPICGMNLSYHNSASDDNKPGKSGEGDHSNHSLSGESFQDFTITESRSSSFRPQTSRVKKQVLARKIRTVGMTKVIDSQIAQITARVAGRISEVLVPSLGSLIKKGSLVLTIESPELANAGAEYLQSLSSSVANKDIFLNLRSKTENRLAYLGIVKKQRLAWQKTGQVPSYIKMYSQAEGVVMRHHAVTGAYFQAGHVFFEVADLSQLWLEFDIYQDDADHVFLGQQVELLHPRHEEKVLSNIDFISPLVHPVSQTITVRTTISGDLSPGMAIVAWLTGKEVSVLSVPNSAVIHTGKQKLVWVQTEDHVFQARRVTTGITDHRYTEITSGLASGDLVVTQGQFLLDADARLLGHYHSKEVPSQSSPGDPQQKRAGHGHHHSH
ncbi:MAG: efflux RND transporter periplasmic adaptor subunit [Proteobacteria bacterium]|nr:efflux RND transporter periplasmic adaptor subunit [Pseudomonadota bacterium]